MKYFFFINPVAGQGDKAAPLMAEIQKAMKGVDGSYEIFLTNAVGDGRKKAREFAEGLNGEEGRFFACGGDGTAGEIINGIYGFDNIAFGIVPIGTGNDTVRNFPYAGDFSDIRSQIFGDEEKIDLIEYSGFIDGAERIGYCVNMINVGFDCNVVELAGRLKQKPMISGSMAYLAAVFGVFARKKGIALNVLDFQEREEPETVKSGEMLLCAVCNGSYCGGGIKTAPMSDVKDGEFELNIVNDVTRGTFLKLFPKMQKGEHMDYPGIDEYLKVVKTKKARLLPYNTEDFFICVDGEIMITTGITVEMKESALRFIVPKGSL